MGRRSTDALIAVVITVLASAVVWGARTLITIEPMKNDVEMIKSWKDKAIEQMSGMDGKLDALLDERGIEYKPHKVKRGHGR